MQEQGESLNLLPQLITERTGNYIRRVTCSSVGQQVCLANHFLGKTAPLLPPQLPPRHAAVTLSRSSDEIPPGLSRNELSSLSLFSFRLLGQQLGKRKRNLRNSIA
ncbi:rCG33870 [Rattus norvegicus]|uniref:RCG33870 n=1 Tax=Rattus norvegicus TaxID=10116 RepID=A6HL15_RAT|nr:rCG33870 [Rattus norvegicus]